MANEDNSLCPGLTNMHRTNCAPLVANLFLFCYDNDFMKSPSRENHAGIIYIYIYIYILYIYI